MQPTDAPPARKCDKYCNCKCHPEVRERGATMRLECESCANNLASPSAILEKVRYHLEISQPMQSLGNLKKLGKDFPQIASSYETLYRELEIAVEALREVQRGTDAYTSAGEPKEYCLNWMLNNTLIAEKALSKITSLPPQS